MGEKFKIERWESKSRVLICMLSHHSEILKRNLTQFDKKRIKLVLLECLFINALLFKSLF
ncbi:hypothetical protein CWI32_00845 [Acinetobacter pseudolwoffii]|uniref:Uncharacterized protein n=1 Tax=Acinetobacter pseudolwoffii TaxID=2053287 RepID=A0A2H9YUC0_9GAMM|nr:hypothetical protein CWI32_00845 [Acinetobacter pseudolwoffii]